MSRRFEIGDRSYIAECCTIDGPTIWSSKISLTAEVQVLEDMQDPEAGEIMFEEFGSQWPTLWILMEVYEIQSAPYRKLRVIFNALRL